MFVVHEVAELLVFVLRLGGAAPDDGHDAGEDADLVRRPAVFGHQRVHLAAEGLCVGDGALGSEHHVGRAGRQIHAHAGRTGLRNHRATLRGTGDVQRPTHAEMRAFVVENVHLVDVANQMPLALSRRKASSSQLSHKPRTTS